MEKWPREMHNARAWTGFMPPIPEPRLRGRPLRCNLLLSP